MITIKEFRSQFGFEPKQDDMHRVNCEQAGEVGHLMCGTCAACDQPRFLCVCTPVSQPLGGLGLEVVGDEVFALPISNTCPTAKAVLGAQLIRYGLHAEGEGLYLIRERKLDRIAFEGAVVHRSHVWKHAKHEAATDVLACSLTAMLMRTIKEMVRNGELIRCRDGIWNIIPLLTSRCTRD